MKQNMRLLLAGILAAGATLTHAGDPIRPQDPDPLLNSITLFGGYRQDHQQWTIAADGNDPNILLSLIHI